MEEDRAGRHRVLAAAGTFPGIAQASGGVSDYQSLNFFLMFFSFFFYWKTGRVREVNVLNWSLIKR